jgi:hypothetical protein
VDLLIWGYQAEAGAFPTSYIPTAGATATRSADLASIPVSAFGYNQSEGTVVVEASKITASERGMAVSIGDSVNDGLGIDGHLDGNLRAYVENSGVLIFDALTLDTYTTNEVFFVGAAYKSEDFAASANGGSVAVGSGALTSSDPLTQLCIGRHAYNPSQTYLNGHIKSIKYYPRRLTNAQLQELTT